MIAEQQADGPARVGEHSAKLDEVRAAIAQVVVGPNAQSNREEREAIERPLTISELPEPDT